MEVVNYPALAKTLSDFCCVFKDLELEVIVVPQITRECNFILHLKIYGLVNEITQPIIC